MKIEVHHKKLYSDNFTHVATVEVKIPSETDPEDRVEYALEEAFHATNHIDCDWATNKNIAWSTPEPRRSSMSGDRFIIPERNEIWNCLFIGWEKL